MLTLNRKRGPGAARHHGGMTRQLARRRSRQALTDEELHTRLEELRRRQQAQVEFDLRLLRRR